MNQKSTGEQPTGTEAKVCALIAARQRLGRAKYGTTVAQNPLSLRQWLQHGLEEALDLAVYLQRAIDEIDASGEALPVAQGRSGAKGVVAKAPSGPAHGRANGVGAKGHAGAKHQRAQGPGSAAVIQRFADRTKGAVGAMRSIVDQIESGNRQVASVRITTQLGEPMAVGHAGVVFSEKVQIELELCK